MRKRSGPRMPSSRPQRKMFDTGSSIPGAAIMPMMRMNDERMSLLLSEISFSKNRARNARNSASACRYSCVSSRAIFIRRSDAHQGRDLARQGVDVMRDDELREDILEGGRLPQRSQVRGRVVGDDASLAEDDHP